MKVGIHMVSFGWTGGPEKVGPTLAEIGRAAEQAGVDSLSLMDHYLQLGGMLGTAEGPMLEGYTALGFLAASTSNAKLHLLVTGTTYGHPGLLAKIVSTLDVSPAAGRSSASAPRGTSASTGRSAYPSRRSQNGSNGSRRRCRS